MQPDHDPDDLALAIGLAHALIIEGVAIGLVLAIAFIWMRLI